MSDEDEEDLDFEFDEETEGEIEEEIEEEAPVEEIEEEELPPPPEEEAPPPPVSPAEIPLTMSVEVGRVEMSAQELFDLGPGNHVELGIPPGKSVDLMINGKLVGRGELIQMGDVVGVRVLEL